MAGRIQDGALIATLLLALAGCAHPAADVAPVPAKKPVRVEVGENQTDPVRKTCKGNAPVIPEGESVSGVIRAVYLVGTDGRVSEVSVTGKASPAAIKAIQRFIAGCTYAPATRDGKPVAVRWRGELDFTRAPAPR